MRWQASLVLLLAAALILSAGCNSRPQRRLLTDKPGQTAAGGLTWKCGLLGGGLGAAVGFGASMGGTALTTKSWPLQEPIDWVESIPVWGSAVFLGSALGMFIACIGT